MNLLKQKLLSRSLIAVFITGFSLSVFLLSLTVSCSAGELRDYFDDIKSDFGNLYLDGYSLTGMAVALGAGGALANTSSDGDIRDYYQDRIRGNTTDDLSAVTRIGGDKYLVAPVLLGTGLILRNSIVGEWAGRSFRALLAGAPAGLLIQHATGAGTPSQGGSGWRPFKADSGLSGHAFVGAVPFITAARMSDNIYMKSLFYGISVLPGLSRINDDKHYFSQVMMGWALAFLSCDAVDQTEDGRKSTGMKLTLVPLPGRGAAIVLSGIY